jgi:hypothetical protein
MAVKGKIGGMYYQLQGVIIRLIIFAKNKSNSLFGRLLLAFLHGIERF